MENVGAFEIVRYTFDYVDGEPKIVISMVKVLDKNGKYIKFAKLDSVIQYLHQFPVRFAPGDATKRDLELW